MNWQKCSERKFAFVFHETVSICFGISTDLMEADTLNCGYISTNLIKKIHNEQKTRQSYELKAGRNHVQYRWVKWDKEARGKTRLMDRNEFHLYSHMFSLNSLCFKLHITLGGKALNTQIIHQKNTYHLSEFKFLDETHFKGLICFLAWRKYSLSNISPHLFTCFIGICGLHGYHQAAYYWIQVAFRVSCVVSWMHLSLDPLQPQLSPEQIFTWRITPTSRVTHSLCFKWDKWRGFFFQKKPNLSQVSNSASSRQLQCSWALQSPHHLQARERQSLLK